MTLWRPGRGLVISAIGAGQRVRGGGDSRESGVLSASYLRSVGCCRAVRSGVIVPLAIASCNDNGPGRVSVQCMPRGFTQLRAVIAISRH